MTNQVSVDRLNDLFTADFEQGYLYRKSTGKRVGGLCPVGKGKAYYRLSVDGKQIYLHRILVAMRDGEWPESVDHCDGDTLNNESDNLIAVQHGDNMRNRATFKNGNEFGKGVCLATVKGQYQYYRVGITAHGKMIVRHFRTDKPNALLDAQWFAVRTYAANGFSERHYQSVRDAMIANPEFQTWKQAMNADFDAI